MPASRSKHTSPPDSITAVVSGPHRYAVANSFVLTSTEVGGEPSSVVRTEQSDKRYFDTENSALLRAGCVLVCRTDDAEPGWQLITDSELGQPLAVTGLNVDGVIPNAMLELTAAIRDGSPVHEVARIQIDSVTHLVGAEPVTVEIIDSQVRATFRTRAGSVTATEFRQLALQATDGSTHQLLAKLDRRLRKDGAVASSRPVGLRSLVGPEAQAEHDLITRYLAEQQCALLAGDLGFRLDRGDVHATRVATRRLRSTLRNYPSGLDGGRLRELDTELRWYAGVLGAIRDCDVLQARLAASVAQLPAGLASGSLAAAITGYLNEERTARRADLRAALSGDRYQQLLRSVDELVGEATRRRPIGRRRVLLGVAKAEGRLRRRLAEAGSQADGPTADLALHSARKAAKRARYAVELALPALGSSGAKKLRRLKNVQDTLGMHQDGVVAAELLLTLGQRAGAVSDPNAFGYGVLYQREVAAGEADRERIKSWLTDDQ